MNHNHLLHDLMHDERRADLRRAELLARLQYNETLRAARRSRRNRITRGWRESLPTESTT